MGNSLLAYSGLATKVKAMSSRLITDQEFYKLVSYPSVQDIGQYLKNHPAYQNQFSKFDNTEFHRGEIEHILRNSVYNDYLRLYRFADQEQRAFLKLYFTRYEVQVLKVCLRKIFDAKANNLDLGKFYPFFEKHSTIRIPKVAAASTVEELEESLSNSFYKKIFQMVDPSASLTLFDYEIALDLLHFTDIWKRTNKLPSLTERKVLTETYGSQMDLLNVQWIYRSKRYYKMSADDIYDLIIPIHYRLHSHIISAMAEAGTAEEVLALLQTTCYAKYFQEPDIPLERVYHNILGKLYEHAVRKYPYSVACISSYLYKKELEVNRLTSVLEGIRYRLPAERILKIIM